MKIDKNFVWNCIGLTLNAFISLIFLIIVNRINGTNYGGIFSYAYSLDCLFFWVSMYYSRSYQIANYEGKKDFNQFFSFRLVFCIISFLLLGVFCVLNSFDLYKSSIILIIMLYRTMEAISDCIFGYLQSKDELYKTGISYSLKAVLGAIVFLIIDLITRDMLLSIIGFLIANIFVMIVYDFKNLFILNNDKVKFDLSNFSLIFKESLPIFLVLFLGVYLSNLQKYFLVYYETDEIQNIFAIIVMPATMLSLVGNYLINPFLNKLNNYNKKNKYNLFFKESKTIIYYLFGFGVLAFVVTYLLGIPVLNLLYGLKLGEYKTQLLIIIIASVMNAASLILSNVLILIKVNKSQLYIYMISSILSTIITVLLIKQYGIVGAGYSYLFTYGIVFLLFVILFYKEKRERV